MKYMIAVVLSAFLAWSCAHIGSPDPVYKESPKGDVSMGSKFTITANKWEAELKRAHQAEQNGDYEKALGLFEDVYKKSPEDKYKTEALYYLGAAYSAIANPNKDMKKAVFYLDQLLTYYPNSSFKSQAEEKKKSIQIITEQEKKE